MAIPMVKASGLLSAAIYLLERSHLRRQDIIVVWKTGSGARMPGQNPALPLNSSVTLGKLLYLSVLQVSHL